MVALAPYEGFVGAPTQRVRHLPQSDEGPQDCVDYPPWGAITQQMDGIELLVRHTDTERWTLKKNKEKEEEKKNNKH